MVKSLQQLKIDQRNNGWPWPIEHPNDERALLDGCYCDIQAANRVKTYYHDLLILPRDGGGTRPFDLLDLWYGNILAPIFGWKRADGRRRFDKGFMTTGKKNAKSTTLAGLCTYMMVADGEEEAECYATATDRDQASIVYNKVKRSVRESKYLDSIIKRKDSLKRMEHPATSSCFEAISSDADSAEGKNPHLLICDELHVWKDRKFFEALMYGDIQRNQPLFLMITTAGSDITNIGFEEYEFARDLLDPDNPFYSMSHFAYIAEASKERAWNDPEGWKEANPALLEGVGSLEKLAAKCEEARQSPRKQRSFERYICNRWVTDVEEAWLDPDDWVKCDEEIPDHTEDPCSGALDLSKTTDLTALTLGFWNGDAIDLLWWFWMPEDRLKDLEDRDRVPYRDWVKDGLIQATPGNIVDYAYIRAMLTGQTETGEELADCLAKRYQINEIAFDPYNSTKLVTELSEYDGLSMVEHRQGFISMNGPSKEFERRVSQGLINHGNNPVANWMSRNIVVDTDPAGNIKPTKKKSRYKIDGIVTAVMTVGRMVLAPPPKKSVYESRGVLII